MQRGIDCENLARTAYEAQTGNLVDVCGFVKHLTLPAGCSPDGYVGDFDTVVSLKCPKTATHLRYLQSSEFPAEYWPQALHEMWITGARAYHLFSFDDRLGPNLSTKLFEIKRPHERVEDYAAKAIAFLDEVESLLVSLERMAV
jgi:hypothetical protein